MMATGERSLSRTELEVFLSSRQKPSAWKRAQVADKTHDGRKSATVTVDGNGNVMALINGDTGLIAAAYEYDPYGQPLRVDTQDSTVADQPFRFSTKFTDVETGLLYYGHRYYDPGMGRFVCRDPEEETGGINLYGFCKNDGINRWDRRGFDNCTDSPPSGGPSENWSEDTSINGTNYTMTAGTPTSLGDLN